jgi:hypothetical protein
MSAFRLARSCAALSLLVVFSSCRSGPAPVSQPSVDPEGAAELAMEMYDTNHDGKIAGDELEKVPSLKSAMKRVDTNNDSALDAEEIAARIEHWKDMKVGLVSFGFTTTLDGAPIEDAVVTFEPETFLGEEVKLCKCTTGFTGGCGPSVPKELRPTPQTPPGAHMGFYKVKISKIVNGKETIPARYNEQTILGQEVAPDVYEIVNRLVVYTLKSR